MKLTDAGLETVLIFEDGFELPQFAAFPLVDSEEGHGTTITILLPCDLGGFAGLGRLAPHPEGT